jgi:hypothetical protein
MGETVSDEVYFDSELSKPDSKDISATATVT